MFFPFYWDVILQYDQLWKSLSLRHHCLHNQYPECLNNEVHLNLFDILRHHGIGKFLRHSRISIVSSFFFIHCSRWSMCIFFVYNNNWIYIIIFKVHWFSFLDSFGFFFEGPERKSQIQEEKFIEFHKEESKNRYAATRLSQWLVQFIGKRRIEKERGKTCISAWTKLCRFQVSFNKKRSINNDLPYVI